MLLYVNLFTQKLVLQKIYKLKTSKYKRFNMDKFWIHLNFQETHQILTNHKT